MKKIFAILTIGLIFTACNTGTTSTDVVNEVVTDTAVVDTMTASEAATFTVVE